MQSAQYSSFTGQGSRVMANKNNLYKRRPELKVSQLQIDLFFKLVSRLNPLVLPPGRIILVLAIVVGCLGMLWPSIFSPLVFGEAPAPDNTGQEGEWFISL